MVDDHGSPGRAPKIVAVMRMIAFWRPSEQKM
jgi:hypothetical protein